MPVELVRATLAANAGLVRDNFSIAGFHLARVTATEGVVKAIARTDLLTAGVEDHRAACMEVGGIVAGDLIVPS